MKLIFRQTLLNSIVVMTEVKNTQKNKHRLKIQGAFCGYTWWSVSTSSKNLSFGAVPSWFYYHDSVMKCLLQCTLRHTVLHTVLLNLTDNLTTHHAKNNKSNRQGYGHNSWQLSALTPFIMHYQEFCSALNFHSAMDKSLHMYKTKILQLVELLCNNSIGNCCHYKMM